eukprot:12302437-Alexandrium_andersonii.AAC.1
MCVCASAHVRAIFGCPWSKNAPLGEPRWATWPVPYVWLGALWSCVHNGRRAKWIKTPSRSWRYDCTQSLLPATVARAGHVTGMCWHGGR